MNLNPARLVRTALAAMVRALPEPAKPPAAPAEAAAPVREAAGVTIDDDDDKFRPLTGSTARDLSPLSQARAQKLAAYLWETNQLANRLVELPLAYLLAEGVALTCTEPEHQEWLTAFWDDPINTMDVRLPTYARELSLFGELFLPTYVNALSGHVRLGYLDPSLVGRVIVDPGNAAQPIGVESVRDAEGRTRTWRVVVLGEDEELFSPEARRLRAAMTAGDVLYYAVNRFAAGRRGRSDMNAGMDWLDAYDEYLFDQLGRAADLDTFVWGVKITGADQAEIDRRAKLIEKPGRGSVRVHNDQEEWTAVAPDLKASDRTEMARLFRNHSLGGRSIPEHFFGGGGDVNRSTGESMGDPFFKTATLRQTELRHVLRLMGRYVLWQRARAEGKTPDWAKPEWKVQVAFPEMVTKDTAKLTSALQQVVSAVSVAVRERFITRKTAVSMIAVAAKRLEIEIDAEAELADVEEENPTPEPAEGAKSNAADLADELAAEHGAESGRNPGARDAGRTAPAARG